MTNRFVDTHDAAGVSHHQYLTFTLNDQEFGIAILSVQEIRNFTSVTPIPNSPGEVRGVINLRGSVVPILDLKCALGMPHFDQGKVSVIIVVIVGSKAVGLIVDGVSDVIDVNASDIEVPPAMVHQGGHSVVQGIAKSEDRLISLLDLGCLVDMESLEHSPA